MKDQFYTPKGKLLPYAKRLLCCITFLSLHYLVNAQTDCGCTVTLSASNGASLYANGTSLGVKPGATVCIKAGTYDKLFFQNFNGTAAAPIKFVNCGGQVRSHGGISFTTSSYFKFTGTGSTAHTYGFLVMPASGRSENFGFKAYYKTTDFEVEKVEINRFAIGLMIKTDPSCDAATQYGSSYKMRNVWLHHLYVRNIKLEAFYCGYSMTSATVNCSGVNKVVYPQYLENLKISNNIIDSTGWDGIQVGHTENMLVYSNTVKRYGVSNAAGQNMGIILNMGATGKIYNNTVENGPGPNIQVMGDGKIYIYNNVLRNAGNNIAQQNAIFVDDRPDTGPKGSTPLTVCIANNTIVNPSKNGIYMLNSNRTVGTDNQVYNNLTILQSSTYKLFSSSVTASSTNNQTYIGTSAAKFVDAAKANYKPTAASPMVNAGRDVSAYNIKIDRVAVARPQNGTYDIGAYEYETSSARVNTAEETIEAIETNMVADKIVAGKPGLTITPVPARDFLNIYLNDMATGKLYIKIMDAAGRTALVSSQLKSTFNYQGNVNISTLSPGIYFYDIAGDGVRYTGKFVKTGN